MQNTLKSLSPSQQEELNRAIQKIAAATQAEKIYCFGHRHTQKNEWGLFRRDAPAGDAPPLTSYDLLLVMPDKDLRFRERADEAFLRPITPNTQFCHYVFDHFHFYNCLKKGDPFVFTVYHEGALLHDSSSGLLFDDAHNLPKAPSANASTLLWVQQINLARSTYRMAERSMAAAGRWQTLRQLEEAACYTCIALIALYLGHRQRRAMLSQLLLYCDNFCALKSRVFPCNTAEEMQLYQCLEMAVVKEEEDYGLPIPMPVLDSLMKRVNKMIELADWLYAEKTRVRTNARARNIVTS